MVSSDTASQHILALSCASAPGQVAAVTGFLEAHGCYIDEISAFDDKLSQSFFARCVFHAASGAPLPLNAMRENFLAISRRFNMEWSMAAVATRPRVLIMVSKLDHCLNDLIYRWRMGELKMDIAAIVSNHPDLEPIAAANGIAFHHLPVTPETKPQQEAKLLGIIEQTRTELVVLARYMQIL